MAHAAIRGRLGADAVGAAASILVIDRDEHGADGVAGRAGPRRIRLERRGAIALLVVFVLIWLAFIFAGSLARATDLDARLSDARALTAALEAQVEAGYAEIDFVESPAFLELAARRIGYGTEGEQSFALPDDAPPPAALPVIGSDQGFARGGTPLDAWLELLFGPS
jgi:cell division protein FtsB